LRSGPRSGRRRLLRLLRRRFAGLSFARRHASGGSAGLGPGLAVRVWCFRKRKFWQRGVKWKEGKMEGRSGKCEIWPLLPNPA
jgi:hypothetical protein